MMAARWIAALAVTLLAGLLAPARADDTIYAGGRVFGPDGKKPLAGALVAVYGDKGDIIASGKTDSEGRYTLAIPRGALHLPAHHSDGFIVGMVKGVGKLAGAAVTTAAAVGSTVVPGADIVTQKLVTLGVPQNVAHDYVVNAQSNKLTPAMTDQLMNVLQQHGMSADQARAAINSLPANGGKASADEKEVPPPGALRLKVAAPDQAELEGVTHVYAVREGSAQVDGKLRQGLIASVDAVKLAPEKGPDKPAVLGDYLTLKNAKVEPGMVEKGQKITVSADLAAPPDLAVPVVVIARNSKTGEIWQLNPDGKGGYRAEIATDKGFDLNDQTLSLLAYAGDPEHPGRDRKAEGAIDGAGCWKLDKPFVYNPFAVLSRNRADLKVTIVKPAKR